MKKTLDLRGMLCPKPVIETQKAFKEENVTEFVILVDNMTARENLKRLAGTKEYNFSFKTLEGYEEIIINRDSSIEEEKEMYIADCNIVTNSSVLMITREFLGEGNDELGKVLMKGFLYTITETLPYPEKIILLNSGVKLSTTNEETLVHLQKLEKAGVKIYTCGTCLNYYDLANELKVGVIGNMYDVVESLINHPNRITI